MYYICLVGVPLRFFQWLALIASIAWSRSFEYDVRNCDDLDEIGNKNTIVEHHDELQREGIVSETAQDVGKLCSPVHTQIPLL